MSRVNAIAVVVCMFPVLWLRPEGAAASSSSVKTEHTHNETAESMKHDSGPVLEPRLEWSEDLDLRAVVRNVSPDTVVFLVHSLLMPSKLILRTSLGFTMKAKDIRSRMRFDTRVPKDAFVNLAPGEEHTLATGVFTGSGSDGYSMTWDAFSFNAVKPGVYSAKVEWESVNDQYFDKEAGAFVTLPGVWKGKIVSETIKIRLPRD